MVIDPCLRLRSVLFLLVSARIARLALASPGHKRSQVARPPSPAQEVSRVSRAVTIADHNRAPLARLAPDGTVGRTDRGQRDKGQDRWGAFHVGRGAACFAVCSLLHPPSVYSCARMRPQARATLCPRANSAELSVTGAFRLRLCRPPISSASAHGQPSCRRLLHNFLSPSRRVLLAFRAARCPLWGPAGTRFRGRAAHQSVADHNQTASGIVPWLYSGRGERRIQEMACTSLCAGGRAQF